MGIRTLGILLMCCLLAPIAYGQQPDGEEPEFRHDRFWPVVGGAAVADVGAMYALSSLWYGSGDAEFQWYSDRLQHLYPGTPDDGWLDDWHTYVQQDKLGHFFTAYQLARLSGAVGRWTGMSRGRAALFGGVVSNLFQAQIEYFDGYALDYGASRTDLLANVAGGVLGGLQVAYPNRTDWFALKYSYHFSPYHDTELSPVGPISFVGNALKDYQGISYWLVVRPEKLLRGEAKRRWPDWLGVSLGYSGDEITHAISGMREARLGEGPAGVHRRQIFLSLDVDILAENDWPQPWKAIAGALSFVRIPMPAVEFSDGVRWHWLYY